MLKTVVDIIAKGNGELRSFIMGAALALTPAVGLISFMGWWIWTNTWDAQTKINQTQSATHEQLTQAFEDLGKTLGGIDRSLAVHTEILRRHDADIEALKRRASN